MLWARAPKRCPILQGLTIRRIPHTAYMNVMTLASLMLLKHKLVFCNVRQMFSALGNDFIWVVFCTEPWTFFLSGWKWQLHIFTMAYYFIIHKLCLHHYCGLCCWKRPSTMPTLSMVKYSDTGLGHRPMMSVFLINSTLMHLVKLTCILNALIYTV